MTVVDNLALGFSVALKPDSLMYCFVGVSLGTFIGVLPGLGPMVTIGVLLPVTYYLDPTLAIIMLAGIYYGSQYGNSTASILLNLPGTSAGAVACLDGYPMAQKGRAGVALLATAVASFIGGIIGVLVLGSMSPLLARFALNFGPAEYFSLMLLGLLAAAVLVKDSAIKGVAMVLVGLLIGIVGIDIYSGQPRFTFGVLYLSDGIGLVPIATGIFGLSLIMGSAGVKRGAASVKSVTFREMAPSRSEVRRSVFPILRGAGIGSVLGALPGAGPTISTFISYAVEKRVSSDPSEFGKGAIEGVAGPEASNNSASQTGFVPTLTLGIPGDPVMAVMLGALMIHGITPGPLMLSSHPDLFWGLVVSFLIGNLMLLVLNIPLIGLWVQILKIRYGMLYPLIISFLCVGVYSINNSTFEVLVVLVFGLLGYLMLLLRFEPAPLLLGFILAPMLEEQFRRALILSRGRFDIFFESWISIILNGLFLGLIVWTVTAGVLKRRRARLQ